MTIFQHPYPTAFRPAPSGTPIITAVPAVTYWAALVALERPWAEGDTRADIRRKHEQTKAMTREQFRSERLTQPGQQLFGPKAEHPTISHARHSSNDLPPGSGFSEG